jgi:hypothetical protein
LKVSFVVLVFSEASLAYALLNPYCAHVIQKLQLKSVNICVWFHVLRTVIKMLDVGTELNCKLHSCVNHEFLM